MQNLEIQTETISEPLPESNPLTSLLGAPRRRTGHVARKTKEIRDRVNQMLLDGLPYLEIISALGADAEDLNEDIIGRWKAGGYQDWLREQEKIDLARSKQEFASDVPSPKDGTKINQATIQIAAANLCEMLLTLDPSALRESLEKDPDKYTRLLNAIVRLADGEIRCEQHQAEQARLAKGKTPAEQGGITDASMKQAKDKLHLM
jgi:hypothetical protein